MLRISWTPAVWDTDNRIACIALGRCLPVCCFLWGVMMKMMSQEPLPSPRVYPACNHSGCLLLTFASLCCLQKSLTSDIGSSAALIYLHAWDGLATRWSFSCTLTWTVTVTRAHFSGVIFQWQFDEQLKFCIQFVLPADTWSLAHQSECQSKHGIYQP